jgi:hypothetical protein
MALCEVYFMAEKQSFSATISLFTPTFYHDFHMPEYHVGDTS